MLAGKEQLIRQKLLCWMRCYHLWRVRLLSIHIWRPAPECIRLFFQIHHYHSTRPPHHHPRKKITILPSKLSLYIYIYIYTRFQKGFHIERYIDRYIFCFLARAPVCIYTCYCPTCEKTWFNNNFSFRQVLCCNLSIKKKIMHEYCLQFSWFPFS